MRKYNIKRLRTNGASAENPAQTEEESGTLVDVDFLKSDVFIGFGVGVILSLIAIKSYQVFCIANNNVQVAPVLAGVNP